MDVHNQKTILLIKISVALIAIREQLIKGYQLIALWISPYLWLHCVLQLLQICKVLCNPTLPQLLPLMTSSKLQQILLSLCSSHLGIFCRYNLTDSKVCTKYSYNTNLCISFSDSNGLDWLLTAWPEDFQSKHLTELLIYSLAQ